MNHTIGRFSLVMLLLSIAACSTHNKIAEPSNAVTATPTHFPLSLAVITPQAKKANGVDVQLLLNENNSDLFLRLTRPHTQPQELTLNTFHPDYPDNRLQIGTASLRAVESPSS